jgi:tripartite motif-containing protein 2/3
MVCICLLQVLTPDLEFVRHIENEGLAGRSCTGIAVSNSGLVIVNWRTRTVTELSPLHGDTLSKFSHNAFQVKNRNVDVSIFFLL